MCREKKNSNIFSRRNKLLFIVPLMIGFLISFCVKPFFKKKIILVGGNLGRSFDDNAKYMYLFLKKKEEEYKVYWFQRDKVKLDRNIDRYLQIGSIRGYTLYFLSEVVFFSHSIDTDLCPLATRVRFLQPFKVYLSHGVEGLKKRLDKKLEYADFYPCTNKFEYEIKNESWHIDKKKLAVTGIARYDGLMPQTTEKKVQTILYMPTWREWYYGISKTDFLKTDFFEILKTICTDKKLTFFLKNNNLKLIIRLHPFFEMYADSLIKINKNDSVVYSSDDISTLVDESDLLITDYSSVSWDFLYSNKPVIFFQYDIDRFMEERGSYLEIPKDLFGVQITLVSELRSAICDIVFKKIKFKKLRDNFFEFSDKQNCSRIFQETLDRED